MHTVYDADDPMLAHLLVGVLSQAGIEARVLGDHLQGAMGELPALGLLRVVVASHDLALALELTHAWEADLREVHPDDLCAHEDADWDDDDLSAPGAPSREAWMGEGDPQGRVPPWMWWVLALAVVTGCLVAATP